MRLILTRVWKIWLSLVVVVLVVGSIVGGVGWWMIQPAQPAQSNTQGFIVPKGQSVRLTGKKLQQAGFIRQELVFPLVVKWLHLDDKLQAGTFQISPSWSIPQIAHELTKGTTDVWITIPEGWRREEIADYLSRQDLPAFDKAEFLTQTADQEGRLFPDTYLVPKQITAEGLATIFTVTFDKKIVQGLAPELKASQLTLKQALILASLIEREAGDNAQMPIVASVLSNRLELGMPLQVDATLQYVKGYSATEKSWWTTPLGEDRQLDSAFNTYKHPGLPPAPISSPGVAAVRAALQPAQSSNLFYIHDAQGKIHPAKTLEEHNANVAKYLR